MLSHEPEMDVQAVGHLVVDANEDEKDIRQWIALWNENPRPYVWVKTADQILESLAR